jgi:hypothetical protein
MKTTALFLFIILLSSCSEDEEYCFVCKTTSTTFTVIQGATYPSSTISSVRYCGVTQEEADANEKAGTSSEFVGGVKTYEKRTECTKR